MGSVCVGLISIFKAFLTSGACQSLSMEGCGRVIENGIYFWTLQALLCGRHGGVPAESADILYPPPPLRGRGAGGTNDGAPMAAKLAGPPSWVSGSGQLKPLSFQEGQGWELHMLQL